MPEWTWHTGAVNGRCGGCDAPLMPASVLVNWRGRTWCVGCLLDALTKIAAERSTVTYSGFYGAIPHP